MANKDGTETFTGEPDTAAQRKSVLDAADNNLKTVIDQVKSLGDDKSLEDLLNLLDAADKEMDRQRGA